MPELRLSSRAQRRRPSPIRALAPLMRQEGLLSLGGGYPNPATFAFDRLTLEGGGHRQVIEDEVLRSALQYGATPGSPRLIEALRAWHLHKDGVELDPNQLIVLTGSQEGLYLMGDVLVDEGSPIALSDPTYPGALAAFNAFAPEYITLPINHEGLCVQALAARLEERRQLGLPRPAFIYTIPSGHNPAGVTLSLERRHGLAELAQREDLWILEDDPYQLVSLDQSEPLPTLQSLAPEHVLRLDSFSKILTPGLRIGYASGPAKLIEAFGLQKQSSTLHTSSLSQEILADLLTTLTPAGLRAQILKATQLYRDNRDRMCAALERRLPKDVSYVKPDAGMFIWFELPSGFNAQRMIEEDALDLGVLLVPGSAFSPFDSCNNAMRASFSMLSAGQIDEAVERFVAMIERERARLA